MKRIFLLAFILLFAAGGYWLYQSKYYGGVCRYFGGRWAGAAHSCITPWCYKLGSCGKRQHPESKCRRVPIGAPIEKVYFELGEPDMIEGNKYQWRARDSGELKVNAVIKREKLKVIICAR